MSNFGTNVGQKFVKNSLKQFFQQAIAPMITNQDYEGEIKGGGADRVNVLTFGALALKSYTGVAMTVDVPSESNAQLIVNQKKAWYFQIESFAKFSSYVSNPQSQLIETAGKTLAQTVDNYILSLYANVGSGNRVGTNYTTGTVTVTTVTGAVTGSGTTFTSAMVGLGFKATGHTSWYRIASYASATSIVIMDDLLDITQQYTGGTIGAGATYVIEANTPITETKSTIYADIVKLKTALDNAKIPTTDRWIVAPSDIASLLLSAPELIPAVPTAYQNVVENGMLGTIAGFKVFQSQQVAGDNTNGWYVLAGHKSFITMAMAFTESGVEDFIGGFGQNFKSLTVYGAKTIDERRKAGAYLFCHS